jgi:phenylalanyl-tRNA synthetase beta chain
MPNMIRNACVLGVAREIAAQTGKPLTSPSSIRLGSGPDIAAQVDISITDPGSQPAHLSRVWVRNAPNPKKAPYWVQRRLAAWCRYAPHQPVIVDATQLRHAGVR